MGKWMDSRDATLEVIPFEETEGAAAGAGTDSSSTKEDEMEKELSAEEKALKNLNRLNVVVNEEGTRFKVAEIEIDQNVFTSPVKVLYKSVN